MQCVFLNGGICGALKTAKCSDACKFRLTKEEFVEKQAEAARVLKSEDLKQVKIKTAEGAIVSTVKGEEDA